MLHIKRMLLPAAAFCVLTSAAFADPVVKYPVDTITAVTYSSVGGGTDVFLREMSKYLNPIMGVNIVVENVTGGSGAKAMARVATAPADGSVVLGTTITIINTSIIQKPEYAWNDLDMIMMYFLDPTILYVRKDSPFKSLKDFVDYAVAHPGELQFGLPNPTAMDRWVAEQMKKKINGFDVNVVSFEGGGDLMLGVLNGTIDIANGEPSELREQIKAGAIRPLAVWTDERLDIMPELPTGKEQGVDIVVNKFRGLAGPKGLKSDVLDAWYKALETAIKDPQFKEWLDANGITVALKNQADYTAFMQEVSEEQAKFLTEIGVAN